MSSTSRDFHEVAAQFEADVLSGAFLTGALFKAAVERQRREVATPPAGYAWSDIAADKACRLAEMLAFPKGPKRGDRFHLEPWQVWLIRVLFGWADAVTGAARFHKATIFLPKGNGKTPLAAIIALIVLVRGRRIGAKAYSAASTQKQAREVFDAAQEMLRLSPEVMADAGLVVGEHAIRGVGDNRVLEPISAEHKSAEGKVPDCVVIDEIHVHLNRKLYDNLCSAASKVDGSRVVVISTAGSDMSPDAIGYMVYGEARDILLGVIDAPAHFALIVEADRDRDPWSPETWRQANPNFGVSISERNFKTAADAARAQPSSMPDFLTKRLGWWQQSAKSFIQPAQWSPLADPSLRLEDISLKAKWMVHVGVDLARTRDLTAVVFVATKMRPDGKREYRVFTRMAYLAEQSVTLKQIPDLRVWSQGGWLTILPGATTGYGGIKDDIEEACEPFPGAEVCFDDWCAAEMEEDLASRGLTCVSIRQGAKTQSEPMRELEAAILDGRMTHDGSPVMAMCMGNLQAVTDRNGNIAPGRENEYKKIDLAVALINALVRASVADPPPDLSAGFQWV
jgi:phage terminase large subunit-like protein